MFAFARYFDPLAVNHERAVVVHAEHHMAGGGFPRLKRFYIDVPIPAVAERAAFFVEGLRCAAGIGTGSVSQGIDVVIEAMGVHCSGIVEVEI